MTQIEINEAMNAVQYSILNNAIEFLQLSTISKIHAADAEFFTSWIESCSKLLVHMFVGSTGAPQRMSQETASVFELIIDTQYQEEIGAYQIVYPNGKIFKTK